MKMNHSRTKITLKKNNQRSCGLFKIPPVSQPYCMKRGRFRSQALAVLLVLFSSIESVWSLPKLSRHEQHKMLGEAKITQSEEGTMTIIQYSPRVALTWESFDIGEKETFILIQPNSSAVALMQVWNPYILGKLIANGQVFFANVNSEIVKSKGSMEVGGLVVSALPIEPQHFVQGYFLFDIYKPAQAHGQIDYGGRITATTPGYIIILGLTSWKKCSEFLTAPGGVFLMVDSYSRVRRLLLDIESKRVIAFGRQLFLNFSFSEGEYAYIDPQDSAMMSSRCNEKENMIVLNPRVNRSQLGVADPTPPCQGAIFHGEGKITYDAQAWTTRIEQFSDRLVVVWDHCSLSDGERLRFNQPGIQGITVNLFRDSVPLLLDGELLSTGQVVFVNLAGITFGPHARTRAGGVIASGAKLNLDRFVNEGELIFSSDPSSPVGPIRHQGLMVIEVPEHPKTDYGAFGYIVFLGHPIEVASRTLFPFYQLVWINVNPYSDQQIKIKVPSIYEGNKIKAIQRLHRGVAGAWLPFEVDLKDDSKPVTLLEENGVTYHFYLHDPLPTHFPFAPQPTVAVTPDSDSTFIPASVQAAPAGFTPGPEAFPSFPLNPVDPSAVVEDNAQPEDDAQSEDTNQEWVVSFFSDLEKKAPLENSVNIDQCVGCHINIHSQPSKDKEQAEQKGWLGWFLKDIVSPWRFGASVAGFAVSAYKMWPYIQYPLNRIKTMRRVQAKPLPNTQEATIQTFFPSSPTTSPANKRPRAGTWPPPSP